MAEAVGLDGLHSLEGFLCDLCGAPCDPQAQELNALDCTFSNCPPEASVYHQDCLEKYLKGIRLEKSRKTGFKCPRGCGKATKYDQPCPGKVNKSHPIHMRNDESKKRKKAVPPPPLDTFKPKVKEKGAAEAGKEAGKKTNKENAAAGEAKAKEKAKAASAALPAPAKPKAPAPVAQKNTKAQIDSIRKELAAKGLHRGNTASSPAPARPAPTQQTYCEYEAAAKAPPSQPATNAWGLRTPAAKVLKAPSPKLQPTPPPPAPAPAPVQAPSTWAAAARQKAQPGPAEKAGEKPAANGLGGPRAVSIWADTQPAPAKVMALVGGEPAEAEPGARMSKAQKKNARRLERKAAQRAAADTSVASSDVVSDFPETASEVASEAATHYDAQNGGPEEAEAAAANGGGSSSSSSDGPEPSGSPEHDRCVQALMAAKARYLMGQLQSLGFADWQAAPAVLAHGADLHAALAFLLERRIASPEQAAAYMAAAQHSPDIGVAEELAMVAEAQSWLGLPLPVVEAAVADSGGDVEAAVEALMPSSRLAQSPEQGAPRSSQAMGQQRGSAGGATSAGFSSPALQPEAAGPAQRLSSIWGGAREQPREASSSGAQQWAGTSRRPESQASPSQPQQPASTSDPSSMWAALQALQPDAAPPSPPAAGLPSQSDLWSSLVIPVQPPPPPPPPQGSPADPRQALLAQGGTPLEKGAPAGSRLLSYTSGAESTPRASSSNLASWQGSLDGSVTSAAAAQGAMQGGGGDVAAWGQGAWFGSNGAAEQKGVHSLERYNQLLAQLPGGSALSSVESTAQPSPQPGLQKPHRQAYQPAVSPAMAQQQQQLPLDLSPSGAWGGLPLNGAATSIWATAPAGIAAGSHASGSGLRPEGMRGASEEAAADLELDSLMATLMAT